MNLCLTAQFFRVMSSIVSFVSWAARIKLAFAAKIRATY